MAEKMLMSEFKKLSQEPWTNIELLHDNVFEWIVAIIPLNEESPYYGGYYRAKMTFPKDYPYSPPDFRFLRPLYHPNVYADGRLCISILHPPGDDEMSGELAAERWSPAQGVESVLISILSLLDDAEISSPANVDAAVTLRKHPAEYRERVKKDLDVSLNDIPEGYEMPTHASAFKSKKKDENDDDYLMSWEDSDNDDDFGGSDSEMGEDDMMGSASEDDDDDDDDDDDEEGEGDAHNNEDI